MKEDRNVGPRSPVPSYSSFSRYDNTKGLDLVPSTMVARHVNRTVDLGDNYGFNF